MFYFFNFFWKRKWFLTVILHRSLRNYFFFSTNLFLQIFIWNFFGFLFELLFPIFLELFFTFSLWTFISLLFPCSLFSLDFAVIFWISSKFYYRMLWYSLFQPLRLLEAPLSTLCPVTSRSRHIFSHHFPSISWEVL